LSPWSVSETVARDRPGDGDPAGRPGVSVDRLGLVRLVEREHKDYMHFSSTGH